MCFLPTSLQVETHLTPAAWDRLLRQERGDFELFLL